MSDNDDLGMRETSNGVAFKIERLADFFMVLDLNKDGVVTQQEIRTMPDVAARRIPAEQLPQLRKSIALMEQLFIFMGGSETKPLSRQDIIDALSAADKRGDTVYVALESGVMPEEAPDGYLDLEELSEGLIAPFMARKAQPPHDS